MKYYTVIHIYDCINVRDDDCKDQCENIIGHFATRQEAEFIVNNFGQKEIYCEAETWYSDEPEKFTWGELVIREENIQLKKIDDIKNKWWIENLKDLHPSYAEEPIEDYF